MFAMARMHAVQHTVQVCARLFKIRIERITKWKEEEE